MRAVHSYKPSSIGHMPNSMRALEIMVEIVSRGKVLELPMLEVIKKLELTIFPIDDEDDTERSIALHPGPVQDRN